MVRDHETKITEFDYENHFHPDLLKNVDTDSAEFKRLVRGLNLATKTEYERLQDNKASFSKLMPLLAGLSNHEMDTLIHKMQNDRRSGAPAGEEAREAIYKQAASDELEVKLAKLSEEENYNMKNWYRHARRTMDWADKSRMPVDERKVRDMLRNQHIIRNKITNEVSNYELEEKNPTLEHGLLQYVNDAAHGDLKDLITDVGINEDSIPFVNF
jgi:hypothetical protein